MTATASGRDALRAGAVAAPEAAVTRPRESGGHDSRVLGLLLVVFGSGWILRQAGVSISWPAILAAVLVALGAGMVVTSFATRRSVGLIAVGVVLSLLVGVASAAGPDFDLRAGDARYAPATVTSMRREYGMGFGDLTLDFTHLPENAGAVPPVRARVTFGRLVVVVPRDAGLLVDGQVGAGELTVDGQRLGDGLAVREVHRSAGYGRAESRVRLELRVVFGNVEVRRGP